MFFKNAPDPFDGQLAIERVKGAVHDAHWAEIAHALRFIRIVDSQLGFDEALEREVLRNDAHEVIAADRRFPIALEQFWIASHEGFARDGHAVRPAERLVILDKVVELVEPSLQELRHEWILYDRRIGFAG